MRDSGRRIAQGRILTVVRSVRRRWRTRIFLRGLARIAAITGAVLLVSALSLEQMRFSAPSVIWLRILTWGTLAATTYWFILRHLFRRVSDEQVGLYLEEHEPSLEHSVVTAIEAPNKIFSPALRDQLVQNALTRARKIKGGRRVEQSAFYRLTGVITGIAVLGLSLVLLGPIHLRLGLAALLLPTRAAAAVNPYEVSIQPGDTTIARGSDQLVTAMLRGFESSDVSIFTRKGPDQTFQRITMLSTESGDFEALLLGVNDPTEYFVEAAGVRSETFSIDVADLPYVDQLDLTYYFPRYTGLEPRTREDGGDIAALPGTLVEVRIHPTMVTLGGQFLIDGEKAQDLSLEEDGTFLARLTVREEGFYSIQLARENGDLVPASPEYRIDLLTDQEPSIHFSKPGRDVAASPIEEVYLEVSANDDYGIGDVRIVYSVNGEKEDTVPLFQGSGVPLPEVSAGHTLFLEEQELEPGDLIAYYALVRDNRTISGTRAVASDMFFLNIRPLERAYRQGEEGGGQQQQGGGGQTPETALSQLQRQIISATFNLIRQRDSYDPEEFSENVVSVSLSQGRLREQIGTLLERMENRGLTRTDPGFIDVSSILPKAVEAMTNAQKDLDTEELREAIPDEQIALRYVQQAEETYERYVTQQQQQPGGGGSQAAAEDLADLFELELDKLKNQYETVQRGAQRQADNELDELLEKLKELSQRQEQQAERQRRRAQVSPQGAPSGGGTSQRELAEQTEEAARQLLRLARENNDQQLEETARQLQQAAEAMRQSASQSGSTSTTEAQTALRRLEETRRQLEEARSDRARRDAQTAINQVQQLQEQQRDVQRQVREIPTSGAERSRAIEQLRERKDQMTEAVSELERELDRSATSSSADNPEAARALQDGANHIRESKLKEKLQYSRGTIEQWDPQSAVTLELTIEADLQALRDELDRAAGAASQKERNPLEEALEEARDLVRGMEAMDRRLSEQGQQGQGQQGNRQLGGQSGAIGGGGPDGQVNYDGRYSEAGAPTRGNPRPLSPEEIRQLQREFGQRGNQVRALREQLREVGRPAQELRAVLDAMEQFQREGIYADPSQVAQLQQEILDQLKRLEFGLRREVEGSAERSTTLSGPDEVPDGYRELVEEYYRALARGRPGGN